MEKYYKIFNNEGLNPTDVAVVTKKLYKFEVAFENIRKLDRYKVLIILRTVQKMEQMMERGNECLQPKVEEIRNGSQRKVPK